MGRALRPARLSGEMRGSLKSVRVDTDIDTLPETLQDRRELMAALFVAERYGVVSVRVAHDAHGFEAEVQFKDAPGWSMRAGDFRYLAAHLLDTVVRYAAARGN
jgi:hypothetical protein